MNNYFNYNDYRIRKLSLNETIKSFNCGDAFIKSFFLIDNKTGCRFITVDAYSDAISFMKEIILSTFVMMMNLKIWLLIYCTTI